MASFGLLGCSLYFEAGQNLGLPKDDFAFGWLDGQGSNAKRYLEKAMDAFRIKVDAVVCVDCQYEESLVGQRHFPSAEMR